MSAELYNSLFDKTVDHSGDEALVAALAQLGRIHRAANDLANDEMFEGTWVHEEQEVQEQMRYAADDRQEQRASYRGGVYQVDVVLGEGGYEATQVSGPGGASPTPLLNAQSAHTPAASSTGPILPPPSMTIDIISDTIVGKSLIPPTNTGLRMHTPLVHNTQTQRTRALHA